MNAVVMTKSSSFCASACGILNPNASLFPIMMPNTKTAMKPLDCKPSAAKYAPITAMSVTIGAYSARKAQRSWAMRSAARYPSTAPTMIPITACLSRSNRDAAIENSPVPMATVNTASVIIAPVASLNADSAMTVWATRSRILICLKMGTNVAGSVDAIVAPSRSATIQETPRTPCAANAVIAAVTRTPSVARTTIVIQTLFKTSKRSDAPPSKRM